MMLRSEILGDFSCPRNGCQSLPRNAGYSLLLGSEEKLPINLPPRHHLSRQGRGVVDSSRVLGWWVSDSQGAHGWRLNPPTLTSSTIESRMSQSCPEELAVTMSSYLAEWECIAVNINHVSKLLPRGRCARATSLCAPPQSRPLMPTSCQLPVDPDPLRHGAQAIPAVLCEWPQAQGLCCPGEIVDEVQGPLLIGSWRLQG